MQKLKPLNDQVVLKPLEKGQQKVGNIIIPDLGHEKPILAEVVEVSKGIRNYHTDSILSHEVKPGDIVIIPKLGAQVVSLEDGEYYICQANQLLAIVYEE